MRLRRVVKQMKTLNSELTSAQIGDRLLLPEREWSNLCMSGVGKCGRLKDLINESQNPIPSTRRRFAVKLR